MTAREVSSLLLELEAEAGAAAVWSAGRVVVPGLRVDVLHVPGGNPALVYFINGRSQPFDDVFLALLESHECGPLCAQHGDPRDTSMGVLP